MSLGARTTGGAALPRGPSFWKDERIDVLRTGNGAIIIIVTDSPDGELMLGTRGSASLPANGACAELPRHELHRQKSRALNGAPPYVPPLCYGNDSTFSCAAAATAGGIANL